MHGTGLLYAGVTVRSWGSMCWSPRTTSNRPRCSDTTCARTATPSGSSITDGPADPRRDDAQGGRPGRDPRAARGVRRPRVDAYRTVYRGRPAAWARPRRGRLRHQAVQPEGADGPGPYPAPAREQGE